MVRSRKSSIDFSFHASSFIVHVSPTSSFAIFLSDTLFLLLLDSSTHFNLSFQPILTENWYVLAWFWLRIKRNSCQLPSTPFQPHKMWYVLAKSYPSNWYVCCYPKIPVSRLGSSRLDQILELAHLFTP